jgi:lipoprotein-anchoring transpeptidase ErfK/SrfK
MNAAVMQRAVKRSHHNYWLWAVLGLIGIAGLGMMIVASLVLGLIVMVGSGRILPGVTTLGLGLNGLDTSEAEAQIASAPIVLTDGTHTWQVSPSQVGITIDAHATAAALQQYGRGSGSLFAAIFGQMHVPPVLTINAQTLNKGLGDFAGQIDSPPTNATLRLINGEIKPVPATTGHKLQLQESVDHITQFGAAELSEGVLQLSTITTQPNIADVTPLMARAHTLLAAPLSLTGYDPIANETFAWTIPQTQWGGWLTTTNTNGALTFGIDRGALIAYLRTQPISKGRYLNMDESVNAIQSALATDKTSADLRVYNPSNTYRVAAGDTIGTIAWAAGIPYWQIAKVNPGVDVLNLSVGQTLTIPSKDVNLPLPLVPNKRIVVSIAHQHMTVYESGKVKWDWSASTGIPSSPTMPGVYQVQSHDKQAYAGRWNLDMPDFMGIYDAVPGFTNGIHGFPTRAGVGLLWAGDLGHKVTYGCILVSTQNAEQLYAWADEGVVVEIQP